MSAQARHRGQAESTAASTGLQVTDLTVTRSGIPICRDVTLSIPEGEITVLLGPNGAGKTTLLDGIAGVAAVTTGTVTMNGTDLSHVPVFRRARAGIGYVEQGRSVFSRLTVAQNLQVVTRDTDTIDRAVALFPRLGERLHTVAGSLSGGEQQMLLIARAFATHPRVLMIDELSLGLAPNVVDDLAETLAALAQAGVGVLLVEQFVQTALRIGTTAHILTRGRVVRSAPCAELRDETDLLDTYFHLD